MTENPTQPHDTPFDNPWWRRLMLLEPAVVKPLIVAIVGVGATLGFDWATGGERVSASWAAIFGVLTVLAGLWTRVSTVAYARTAAIQRSDGQLEAGPAAPQQNGELVYLDTPTAYDPTLADSEPHPYTED